MDKSPTASEILSRVNSSLKELVSRKVVDLSIYRKLQTIKRAAEGILATGEQK